MIATVIVTLAALVAYGVIFAAVGVLSTSPAVPPHRATTAHLQAVYPFQTPASLGGRGCYIGTELGGGSFCFDPWELYAQGRITNPNMVVAGQVGRGKSSLVKTYLWRQAAFGRQSVVIDPKGEFGPLATALGGVVIRLEPGSGVILNPLDPGSIGTQRVADAEVARRQEQILTSLTEAALDRPLHAEERSALGLARRQAAAAKSEPTLLDVVEIMLDPSLASATEIKTTPAALAAASREAALELRRLCHGDLAGMFDGPTSIDLDWDASIVVLDLSALGTDHEALGMVMACAMSWLHGIVARTDGTQRILVLDEAWFLLSDVALARWLRAMFKLSRQYGLSNIVVLHRMSDLEAAGDDGSETARIAQGLLSDTEVRVVYGQAEGELQATQELLGLSDPETALVGTLDQGVALWKVRQSTFVVAHRYNTIEAELVDTDQQMRTDIDRIKIVSADDAAA